MVKPRTYLGRVVNVRSLVPIRVRNATGRKLKVRVGVVVEHDFMLFGYDEHTTCDDYDVKLVEITIEDVEKEVKNNE